MQPPMPLAVVKYWRRNLAAAYDWKCSWYGALLPEDLRGTHVDHVIPVSLGGPDEEWNLQLLHDRCNSVKHDKITPQAVALAATHGVELAELVSPARCEG